MSNRLLTRDEWMQHLKQDAAKALEEAEDVTRRYEQRRIDRILAIPAKDGWINMSDIRKAIRGQ